MNASGVLHNLEVVWKGVMSWDWRKKMQARKTKVARPPA